MRGLVAEFAPEPMFVAESPRVVPGCWQAGIRGLQQLSRFLRSDVAAFAVLPAMVAAWREPVNTAGKP